MSQPPITATGASKQYALLPSINQRPVPNFLKPNEGKLPVRYEPEDCADMQTTGRGRKRNGLSLSMDTQGLGIREFLKPSQ